MPRVCLLVVMNNSEPLLQSFARAVQLRPDGIERQIQAFGGFVIGQTFDQDQDDNGSRFRSQCRECINECLLRVSAHRLNLRTICTAIT